MTDLREMDGTWDYTTLPPNIHLGSGCFIEGKASFRRFFSQRDPGLVLGDNVVVHMYSGFGIDEDGFVEIGDGSVIVGAAIMCRERISIGRRVVLSYNVTIADCDFHPLDPVARRRDCEALAPGGDGQRPPVVSRPVILEDDVHVGIGAVILKGVRVGAGARIGPASVVTFDVPPGALVVGNPGRIVDSAGPA